MKTKENKKGKGCLITLCIFLLLILIANIITYSPESGNISNTKSNQEDTTNNLTDLNTFKNNTKQEQTNKYTPVCLIAGLGDTFDFFEATMLNDLANSFQRESNDDRVNFSNSAYSISYEKTLNNFGDPERIGEIHGNFAGLVDHMQPEIFFKDFIKRYIPKDSKLIKAYGRNKIKLNDQYLDDKKEIYLFKSNSLSKIKGIEGLNKSNDIGKFMLFVNYGPEKETQNQVWGYSIIVGSPSDTDIVEMKTIKNNYLK